MFQNDDTSRYPKITVIFSEQLHTVKSLLVAAATINFKAFLVRPLFEGGYYYKVPQKLREIGPKTDNICTFLPYFEVK